MSELVLHQETHLFKHVVVTIIPTGAADVNEPIIRGYLDGSTTASIDFTYSAYDAASERNKPVVLRVSFNPASGPSAYIGSVFQLTAEECKIVSAEVVSEPIANFKQEAIFKYVDVIYEGAPTIKLYIDGSAKSIDPDNIDSDATADQIVLASASSPKTKRIYFPNSAMRGYMPMLYYSDNASIYGYSFGMDNPGNYISKKLFHSCEIVYTGNPTIKFELDGSTLQVMDSAGSAANTITLAATTANAQNTAVVYFAPVSTGYFPSFRETSNAVADHIISVNYNAVDV